MAKVHNELPLANVSEKASIGEILQSKSRSGVSDLKGSKSLGPPPGYDKDGIIRKFWSNCKIKHGKCECGQEVNCEKTIPVALDIAPHELKEVSNEKEQFELVFIMKMYWQDPKLHSFKTKITRHRPKDDPIEAVDPLEEVKGIVRRKYRNGDLLFIEQEGERYKPAVILRRSEYVFMEEPDWKIYFFPTYTFLNLVRTEAQTEEPMMNLLWCDEEKGGFVEFRRRYDAVFQESLELKMFPLDRQICRIRITAEKEIQDFQFVGIEGWRNIATVHEEWQVEDKMFSPCTTYVRYADEKCEHRSQRSLAKTVLHLQRKGDYYFHNVLINIFLVNVIALSAFAVGIGDIGDRLSLLSTTLVAVTAYQTVINENIPRKTYLTVCDKYIIFAVVYQVLMAVETVALSLISHVLSWYTGEEEHAEMIEWITLYDWIIGTVFVVGWVLGHAAILLMLRKEGLASGSWKEAYEANEEPYAPVFECSTCGKRWLCSQTHQRKVTEQNLIWCECNENRLSRIKKRYYTPGCKGFEKPVVPQQNLDKLMCAPPHLQVGDEQHADDFNQKFQRPAAKAAAVRDSHPPELLQ